LFHSVPIGYVILPAGEVDFDPDEQARAPPPKPWSTLCFPAEANISVRGVDSLGMSRGIQLLRLAFSSFFKAFHGQPRLRGEIGEENTSSSPEILIREIKSSALLLFRYADKSMPGGSCRTGAQRFTKSTTL
jgi:hypothetical protein